MMVKQNENDVTASGDSDPQMSAVGGQCSPQVSLSNPSTKSVGSPKQGHTANNGVGNVTAVGGAEQALDGGRKATEVTATGIVGNLKDANNEVNELSIKFSELKIEYKDEENDGSDSEKFVKKATVLNVRKNKFKRKSRSPEKNERLKKKIKIKPVENQEKIQNFHSVVKIPFDIKCDFHTDLTNSTPAVISKKKNVSYVPNLNNEVNELSIKFSKLKIEYKDEENDGSDLKKFVENATYLNVGKNKFKRKSRSPEKYERLKKKIKIKPVENQEKIQKFHSVVKDPLQRMYRPPRKIKRNDIIDLTLSDDEEQEYRPSRKIKRNDIIDLTLSDDEEQEYRPSRKIKRNDIIDLTLSDDEGKEYRTSRKVKRNDIIDLTLSEDDEPPAKKR